MKISGIITTLNEADNIESCIRSLQRVCDEVIVTDSYSRDNTVDLAQKAGAKVILHEYVGDGPQKNIALPETTYTWVLSIDADERLTDKLVETIKQLDLEITPYNGFAVRRRNYIGKQWIKCCHWYPNYLVRLFRKDKLQFAELKQHAYVPTKNTARLKADIVHYCYRNVKELIAKPERDYSTRGAKILYLNGKKANPCTPFLHGAAAFLSNYFLRGGLFAGKIGLVISKAIARNSYEKYSKLRIYQNDENARNKEDWTSVW